MEIKQKRIGDFMGFLALLFMPFLTQALEFRSFVDKTEVGLNQSFKFNLEFQYDKSLPDEIEFSDIFDLKDFQFLNESTSRQSSFSIINGQMKQTKTLVKSYRLKANSMGVFTIPALKVFVDGKSFQTQPVEIKVVKDKVGRSPPPRQNLNPFNIPFFGNPFEDLMTDPFKEEDLQLKLKLSKKEFYQSEAIRADWFLYYTSRQPHFELYPYPSLKGFWKEEFDSSSPITGTEAIGDTLYRKSSVKSLWLFPLETGNLTIEPYSVNLRFFNAQTLSSARHTIKVKSLPIQGKDLSFTGAVGRFQVDFVLKEREVSLDQPFSFKIVFKGSGHPRFIRLPYLFFPSSVQAYDPVEKSNFENGVGTKEYEILILPKEEGELILPPIKLSVFDPQTRRYVTHKSPEFKLFVKKGEASKNRPERFFEENNNKELKAEFSLPKASLNLYKKWISFLAGFALSFSLIMLFFIAVRKWIAYKKRSLTHKLNNKFLNIKKLLDQKDWQKACVIMIQAGIYVLSLSQIQTVSPDWRQSLKALPPSAHKKYSKSFEKLFLDLESLSFSNDSKEKALSRAELCFTVLKNLSKSFLKEIKPS